MTDIELNSILKEQVAQTEELIKHTKNTLMFLTGSTIQHDCVHRKNTHEGESMVSSYEDILMEPTKERTINETPHIRIHT